MTICIAASCNEAADSDTPPKIVLCSDWRASSIVGTSDSKPKQRYLAAGWYCLTAGTEPEVSALLRLVRRSFSSVENIDTTNIDTLVKTPLYQRKDEKADEYIRGRYAISYDDFKNHGKDRLPPDLFRDVWAAIDRINLDAQLIIVGFADDTPVIYQTDDRCKASIREDFAAIGDGAVLALASLMQRGQVGTLELPRTLYRVFEAKIAAQSIKSVGETTSLSVLETDKTLKDVTLDGKKFLEAKRKDFGVQPIRLFEFDPAYLAVSDSRY